MMPPLGAAGAAGGGAAAGAAGAGGSWDERTSIVKASS